MYEMYEAIPLLGGLVTGLIASQLKGTQLKAIAIALLSITIGLAASTISGEVETEMSWGYVMLDIAQVLVAAVVVTGAIEYWKAYRSRN
ncbi:MAG: hypothetical protein U0175_24295 [Caldilineaceae bacterium]